jgi:integration host factor subunit beta
LFKLLANFALKETGGIMTKSELIERLASQQSHIPRKRWKMLLKKCWNIWPQRLLKVSALKSAVSAVSLHYRAPRTGRNPKTGDKVELEGKYVPHFKPGKNYATAPIFTKSKLHATTYSDDKKAPSVLFYAPSCPASQKRPVLQQHRRFCGSRNPHLPADR